MAHQNDSEPYFDVELDLNSSLDEPYFDVDLDLSAMDVDEPNFDVDLELDEEEDMDVENQFGQGEEFNRTEKKKKNCQVQCEWL